MCSPRMPVAGLFWLAGSASRSPARRRSACSSSEFTIMRAGLAGPNAWAVFVMLVLLIVIFVGFLNHFRAMYFGDGGRIRRRRGRRRTRRAGHPRTLESLVPPAHVAGAIPLLALGIVVAGGVHRTTSPSSPRSSPVRRASAVNAHARGCRRERTYEAPLPRRVNSGARMQFAYAWYPGSRSSPRDCATSCTAGAGRPLAIWRCRPGARIGAEPGAIAPLLSWYEREMTDLCGDPLRWAPAARASGAPAGRVERPPLLQRPAPRRCELSRP